MKTVYIIHGWGGSPDEPMHRWLRVELQKAGFEVAVPVMPDTDEPVIEAWVGKLNEVIRLPNKDMFLIGHSIGCQAVLRYLEKLPEGIMLGGVLLIAPWIKLSEQTIKEEGEEAVKIAKPWEETPINFKKVKKHSDKFVTIFSDSDLYVSLSNEKIFKKELNAEVIIEHNRGHFTADDGVSELLSALEAIKRF